MNASPALTRRLSRQTPPTRSAPLRRARELGEQILERTLGEDGNPWVAHVGVRPASRSATRISGRLSGGTSISRRAPATTVENTGAAMAPP
jgi:hypothetical protein